MSVAGTGGDAASEGPESGETAAPTSERKARQGVLLVLVSAVSFGAMPIFAKLAYASEINLKTLLAVRFTLAAVGMWLIWAGAAKRGARRPPLAAWLPLVLMGAVGYVGQSFSYFTAVSLISASATGLLLYTYPAMVTVLAWLLFRESMSRRKLLALGLSAAGLLMVLGLVSGALNALAGGRSASDGGLGALKPEGVAWALAAAVVYSAYIIAGSRFTPRVNPLFAGAIVISSAAVVYLVWGAVSGELNFRFQPDAFMWAVCIAVVSTVLPITTFFAGLRVLGPMRASIISTIEPAVTVGLASIFLGDRISPEQIVGGILILAAVLVLQLR